MKRINEIKEFYTSYTSNELTHMADIIILKDMINQLFELIEVIEHDLVTSEGLWCTDILEEGRNDNIFHLHHKSLEE